MNAEVVWVQEEPKNMGAWLYVKPRLDTAMRELFGQEVRFISIYIYLSCSYTMALVVKVQVKPLSFLNYTPELNVTPVLDLIPSLC